MVQKWTKINLDNIVLFFGHNEDNFFQSLQFTLMNPLLSLEPVCCKKQPKIVPDQLHTCLRNKGLLKIWNRPN